MDRTEAKEIKKRVHEYTKLNKKDINDLDNHYGMVTHLDKISWSTKSSGTLEALLQTQLVEVMEFQLKYFKS